MSQLQQIKILYLNTFDHIDFGKKLNWDQFHGLVKVSFSLKYIHSIWLLLSFLAVLFLIQLPRQGLGNRKWWLKTGGFRTHVVNLGEALDP